ncbi:MAG: hypothetical protein HC786_20500 [Richelia sp. CSU_2_1]|nr:hypothetical protein [Richelia sp. CSU_2_1]
MDREIEQLKARVDLLEKVINAYGLMKENMPLKIAAIALDQSEHKIRDMVKLARLNPRSRIKAGVHYSFNGNRLLINVIAWERDIKSIPPEKA